VVPWGMTENRNLWSRLGQQSLLVTAVTVAMVYAVLGVSGAFAATPSAQQVVVAPQPGVSCGDLTPGANGTYVFQCTLTGLVAAPSPSLTGSPTVSASATSTPSATATPSATTSSSTSPTVTPSPSPTTTQPPSPTPTPTPTTPRPTSTQNGCINNPGACGFPDAASTGPTSPPLVILNGNQTFSTSGQTIANTRINGCVEVRGANITFRNVQFNVNGCSWGVRNFSTNLQVIDSEVNCGGYNGNAFGSTSMTLTRVDIHGCENGLNVAGGVLVQDSWIHDMNGGQGGAHTDGAQFNQGATDITFRHNTINVGPGFGATSAIIMWNEGDPQNRRVSIDNNLMAWGTYTLYCGRTGVIDNIRITNNRFGPYEYGYANACNSGETWFGNVRDSDGATLAPA
jgi:hypothetical protein